MDPELTSSIADALQDGRWHSLASLAEELGALEDDIATGFAALIANGVAYQGPKGRSGN